MPRSVLRLGFDDSCESCQWSPGISCWYKKPHGLLSAPSSIGPACAYLQSCKCTSNIMLASTKVVSVVVALQMMILVTTLGLGTLPMRVLVPTWRPTTAMPLHLFIMTHDRDLMVRPHHLELFSHLRCSTAAVACNAPTLWPRQSRMMEDGSTGQNLSSSAAFIISSFQHQQLSAYSSSNMQSSCIHLLLQTCWFILCCLAQLYSVCMS